MSTVASTNPESNSDAGSTATTTSSTATAPSTTAPSTKAPTAGSTVAGSTAGTGASSTGGTAPSTAGTAPAGNTPAATTATAGATSATNDLKSWFDSRKSVLSEYLDKFKRTAPAFTRHVDASTTNANASLNDRNGGNGVERVGNALLFRFDCTAKSGGTAVLEADGRKATITWGPSPDGENHFNVNTGAGGTANNTTTTTIQTTVPPDLSSFVSTTKEKVKRPPIPSSFKSFFETPLPQRAKAPDTPLTSTWDLGWKVADVHKKDGPLTQEECDKYEENGRSILDALDELRRSETKSSTFQSHLPTFEMYDRACRMKTPQGQVPDTPIDKANYAANTLCNRGVPLCDDDKSTFKDTLYKHFKKNHDLLPTLPTTRDGLDPYRASGIMMGDDGVPHEVRLAVTQTGRYLSAMNNRKILWEENLSMNPPKTWDEMTDLGWRITDWAHQHGRCGKEDGKGVDEGDVRAYVLDMIQSGQEIPRGLPQSIIDKAEARRNGANDKSFDNCRGPEPLISHSEGGPAIANTDKPSNYWPDFKERPLTETSSKEMSLYQRLKDEGKLSEAVQKFFGSFPKRV